QSAIVSIRTPAVVSAISVLGAPSSGLERSSMDHAAGQPLARVAGRIGLVVILALVDDQGRAVTLEQRARAAVERHALDRDLPLHASGVRHLDIRQVAEMGSARVVLAVLLVLGIEVLAGRFERGIA